MVRSRQLAAVPARSGAIRLTVTAVERARDPDGTVQLLAFHGTNARRPWRLTMPDALAALGSGRYVFEIEFEGERRRAEVLGTDGARRLFAPSPVHGDLIEALPDWREPDHGVVSVAGQRASDRAAATPGGPAG